ncbi:sec-independent protein translocase protein TatB [Shimia gijangensis]|uniref:Sec-independent protein translocase protein TatB n=1 Tax=Shimia gijangensis TaxID=1470563 RepID=A0A1M6L7N0_9RHOB|nr:Sec-independent protein translocase protein TatB [Shimia gijangensis]SHJ67221.1 sec-independent protein translocase protein TatB [Shimia gijangensis]
MFDIGMPELLVIGVVALIVVGPKDLPMLFQQVGKFVGKAKGMAREFSSAMNQAADSSGVRDVTDTLKSTTDTFSKVSNPVKATADSARDALKSVTDLGIDPTSNTGKLAAERAEDARKIRENSAKKAQERLDAEAKAAEDAAAEAKSRAEAARQSSETSSEAPEEKA